MIDKKIVITMTQDDAKNLVRDLEGFKTVINKLSEKAIDHDSNDSEQVMASLTVRDTVNRVDRLINLFK